LRALEIEFSSIARLQKKQIQVHTNKRFTKKEGDKKMKRELAVLLICLFISSALYVSPRIVGATLPTPQLLAGNLASPGCIALDSEYLYFTEYNGGSVKRIPKSGGTVETLVSGDYGYPWRLVVDGDYVYYIVHESGLIKRLPKNGGPVEVLASVETHPWDLATDSDYVYFTVRDGPGSWGDPNGYVAKVPKSGGSIQVLANAQHPNGIAVDSDFVYFTERDIGNIKKVSKSGGAVDTLVSGLTYTLVVAVSSGYVYFTDNNVTYPYFSAIDRVPVNGGVAEVFASKQQYPFFLVFDSDYLYFTEAYSGNVKRVGLTDKIVETLATGFDNPNGIAIDSESLYFSEMANPGGVYRLTLQPHMILATVDLDPDSLSLKSKGKWTTGYIEVPEDYDVHNINVSTIKLNDTIQVDLSAPTAIGDYDNDLIPDLMVMFSRTDVVQLIVSESIEFANVTISLTGRLNDGTCFSGSDVIKVSGLVGDVNCDGKVNARDVVLGILACCSHPGSPRWNDNANFAPLWDVIDLRDIAKLLCHYGEHY
jgi:sugar lactone lactonase YvrE